MWIETQTGDLVNLATVKRIDIGKSDSQNSAWQVYAWLDGNLRTVLFADPDRAACERYRKGLKACLCNAGGLLTDADEMLR